MDYFRQFFFGGRCEVFDFNIWERVFDYDKNSLYAYIMQKYTFPIHLTMVKIEKPYDKIRDKDFVGIEATIEEKGYLPLMPERIEKRLMFREGIKKVFMFKEEVDYLLSINQIKIIQSH